MNEFIDCHCHLFNLVDIPLYATLHGEVKVRSVERIFASAGLKYAFTLGLLDEALETKEAYIRFFERSVAASIGKFKKHLKQTVNNPDCKTLITPLIMDFDCIDLVEQPESITGLEEQLKHLLSAIEDTKDEEPFQLKICPFIGFDLRKLQNCEKYYKFGGFDAFKKLWNTYALHGDDNRKMDNLASGNILGIKLYPPIGFNPYPSDSNKTKYKEFYKWCCVEKDIPLTVHCQESSYNAGNKKKKVNRDTNPLNWKQLFDENPDFKDLRINFAHFGGEEGMEDMFDPWRIIGGGLDKDSWTYCILELLMKYPNTYADISAYDFADDGARENFAELIDRSWKNDMGIESDCKHELIDKLLWGSDVPMVISSPAYQENKKGAYAHLLKKFRDTVYLCKKPNNSEKEEIIKKMTSINPKKFLRIDTT